MREFIMIVGAIALFILTIGLWAFVLLYHVLSDWRASVMGRHFMSFMVVCALALSWGWVGLVFEEIPMTIRLWVRVGLYGGLAVIVWRQVAILIRMQVVSRTEKEEEEHGQPT